ncbi:hypothetical protein NLG97_g1976 [Lecanicillium saksenae]|uniref:Uncharacterized protein n=1 Tax=Lecanicillium saksenae TaxID=468837 RepID=A0ACC1R2A8_9HYPO|nr:hypothetical protein NLG97_g1976 [Lecanicillium saksenae]
MPPTSSQSDMPVYPVRGRHGKDAVPRTMYAHGAMYTGHPPFDATSATFSPLSTQWDSFQQSSGSHSDSSSNPSLTPTGATFGSCDFGAGMQANTMHPNMGYAGVGDNDMLAAAQSLLDVGNLSGSNGSFQPASNPFFFCSDFGVPAQPGYYPNGMENSFAQMQSQFQQQQLIYRTQQLNSAMMLQRYWGGELPPQLKQTCPDEERYLFNMCWAHRFKDENYMWDLVEAEFQSVFNKTYTRDQLKEKLVRCRAKYIEWLPKDKEILRRAWMRIEQNRYQSLLEHFYALGGSRNMMLSANDIQYKVVNEMGLEDDLYVEEKPKKKGKRRVGCQNCASCAEAQEGSTIIWCDRYAGTAYN